MYFLVFEHRKVHGTEQEIEKICGKRRKINETKNLFVCLDFSKRFKIWKKNIRHEIVLRAYFCGSFFFLSHTQTNEAGNEFKSSKGK